MEDTLRKYLADADSQSQAYARIRKAIGYNGITIPLLCLSLALTCECSAKILPSISHYYYTIIGDAFVGVMFSLGLFLALYRSVFIPQKMRKWENKLTNIAGVFAWIVALIPTDLDGGGCYFIKISDATYDGKFGWLGNLHLPAAALMLIIFGYISYHYFPRNWVTGELDSDNKKIYRGCAWVIFVSIFILVLYFIDKKFIDNKFFGWLDNFPIVFTMECTAIIAFAVSWLKKGRAVGALLEVYHKIKKK